jgi:hypothetical protein
VSQNIDKIHDKLTLEKIYEYKLLNLHDSLPFITISAGSSNGTYTDGVGVLRLDSGEWHMDLVAIAFYLFAIHRFIVYGFIFLYDVAV